MPTDPVERLQARRLKLEAELKALREIVRQEEEKRQAIAGRAVLAHAQDDAAFRAQLAAILDRALTKRRERKLFGLSVAERQRRRGSTQDREAQAGPAEAATG